ncbi:MAG: putative fluoride ion transporter CrcB [Acidimicrobiia bacterium]|jgi:CrcB protein
MIAVLAVAGGGALGAVGRYLLTGLAQRMVPSWPAGTTLVNIVGGLIVGVIAGALAARQGSSHYWQLFLIVGLCGGFTTFSAYSLETVRLLQSGAWPVALISTLAQVVGSLLATGVGLWIVRQF